MRVNPTYYSCEEEFVEISIPYLYNRVLQRELIFSEINLILSQTPLHMNNMNNKWGLPLRKRCMNNKWGLPYVSEHFVELTILIM